MSNLPLGEIITTPQEKDAIHVAVAPVEAGGMFAPGEHVRIENGKAVRAYGDNGIGVVDPFLRVAVKKGDRFWLFLYPGTITSLRHDWAHPAFPAPSAVVRSSSPSEAWLREFAPTVGRTYEALLGMVGDIQSGHAFGGDDRNADQFNENKSLLIQHLAAVTGQAFPPAGDVYFSCSC